MSERIEEIHVDNIPYVTSYPLERVHFMLDKYPDNDVFLECKGCNPYLLVRTSPTRYSFFGYGLESTLHELMSTSDREWSAYMGRSYKIIRDKGALPYAHRS